MLEIIFNDSNCEYMSSTSTDDNRFAHVFIDIVHDALVSWPQQNTNLSSRLAVYSNLLIVQPASKMINMHSISLTTLESDSSPNFIAVTLFMLIA